MSFEIITLNSWKDIHDYAKPDWLYRGQGVDRPLKSSLERLCETECVPPKNRQEFEMDLLRQFRRTYHHYSVHVPPRDDMLEWLSLMQHHGAPTRLLDFTYSVYVAAYFALEKATKDCVVWAINRKWAFDESIRLLRRAGKKYADNVKEPADEKYMNTFAECFRDHPHVACVCPQNPFRLNERLRIQSGVFLVPGSIEQSFETNLCGMRACLDPKNLFKLVIPQPLRKMALRNLFEMNISQTTLFPGLHGYARTLAVYHPAWPRKSWSDWKGRK